MIHNNYPRKFAAKLNEVYGARKRVYWGNNLGLIHKVTDLLTHRHTCAKDAFKRVPKIRYHVA